MSTSRRRALPDPPTYDAPLPTRFALGDFSEFDCRQLAAGRVTPEVQTRAIAMIEGYYDGLLAMQAALDQQPDLALDDAEDGRVTRRKAHR
jgi:hypothetical protein